MGVFRDNSDSMWELNESSEVDEWEEIESESEKEVGVLASEEVLAAEILSNPKLLAVFLKLGVRPCAAKELVGVAILEEQERGYSRSLERKKIPQSTAYRLLKRLIEAELVEACRGIDRRKRYYKLTELGEKVLDKVVEVIKSALKQRLRGKKLEAREFVNSVEETLRVPFELVAPYIKIKTIEGSYGKYCTLT